MRILITANKVPYIWGGAEIHINNLYDNLILEGHDVDIMYFPFTYLPESEIHNMINFTSEINCESFNGAVVDKVISLQFPSYYANHPDKVIWLIHQHRAVYDLFNEDTASRELRALQKKIIDYDNRLLPNASKIFTISENVTNRLMNNNRISSTSLYHPPLGEENFYSDNSYNYIFYPSRIETLKRQDLLINAMRHTKSPMKAIIAGGGGQRDNFQSLIEKNDLGDKVRIIDEISIENRDLLYALYARSLCVFFGPYDEDYGYITVESMLASKPVITCSDSGGPLEFIQNNQSGFIVAPDPKAIADKIDWLYYNKKKAKEMGEYGLEIYKDKNINWTNVINRLLE